MYEAVGIVPCVCAKLRKKRGRAQQYWGQYAIHCYVPWTVDSSLSLVQYKYVLTYNISTGI